MSYTNTFERQFKETLDCLVIELEQGLSGTQHQVDCQKQINLIGSYMGLHEENIYRKRFNDIIFYYRQKRMDEFYGKNNNQK
jgi:hypothetical protein